MDPSMSEIVDRPSTSSTGALVGILLALVGTGSVMGVFAYRQVVRSEEALRALREEAACTGGRVDAEGCVDWVLGAQKRCAAMQSLCQGAIPGLLETCLAARPERPACASIGEAADTHWSYRHCAARGFDRRDHGCAIAYLALASFCARQRGGGGP